MVITYLHRRKDVTDKNHESLAICWVFLGSRAHIFHHRTISGRFGIGEVKVAFIPEHCVSSTWVASGQYSYGPGSCTYRLWTEKDNKLLPVVTPPSHCWPVADWYVSYAPPATDILVYLRHSYLRCLAYMPSVTLELYLVKISRQILQAELANQQQLERRPAGRSLPSSTGFT